MSNIKDQRLDYHPNNSYHTAQGQEPSRAHKYPRQIWAAVRRQESLVCDQNLHAPMNDSPDVPYLYMHSGYSVYNLNYVSKEFQILTNIPAGDVPFIIERYRMLSSALFQERARKHRLPNSPAYRVQLRGGKEIDGATPAEVLSMQGGAALLAEAEESLRQNLSRYPRNGVMINAIQDALSLYGQGNLIKVTKPNPLPPLYKKDFKYKKATDEKGNHLVYHILIECFPAENLPWRFTLTNYYAPLLSKEGLTQPDTQRKYGEHKKMINITEEEMALFIYRIQRTMECFEDNVFPRLWGRASDVISAQRKNI